MYANIMSKRSLFEDFFRLLTLNCNIDNDFKPRPSQVLSATQAYERTPV